MSEASVEIDGSIVSRIGTGILVYLGVATQDDSTDVQYMCDKVAHLRIFPDENDRINLDVGQARGQVLVVSAFAVQADARRGRRPTFDAAAPPEQALPLYERFCDGLSAAGIPVSRGVFRAAMDIRSTNAGPVCILLDSKRLF